MTTAAQSAPILFLDFDGVLHPGNGVDSGFLCRAPDDAKLEFPSPCLELIACDPRTGVGVEQAGELRRWLRATA